MRHLLALAVTIGFFLALAIPALAAQEELPADPPAEGQPEPNPVSAASGRPSISGTLRFEDGPIANAEIKVFDQEGTEVATARSDQLGAWRVELPQSGRYRVLLDDQTLPTGVLITDPERAELSLTVRPGQNRTILFPLGEQTGGVSGLFAGLAQVTVNGLKFGFIIAITALGLSIVFGTTRLINFAHGDMVTVGAVVAFFFNAPGTGPQMHIVPAGLLAVIAGGGLGASLERFIWRPLRHRKTGVIQLLVITIGLALLLRHLILLVFGGRPRRYLEYAVQSPMNLPWIRVTPRDLSVIGISAVVLILIGLMLLYTRFGKAMRAISDNKDLAESSGVDVDRVILLTWCLGGALAALGGVLLGVIESVDYLMGFRLLLLMFAAVILGGLGTAFGAMAGGIVVGVVTEVSVLFSPPELKLMWGLAALVAVLLIRPQGIFGRLERVG